MSEDKYSLASKIVDFSIADNPAKVKDTVDQLMLDKIQSEVEARKIDLARQMFNDTSPDPNEEDAEDEDFPEDVDDEELEDDSDVEEYSDDEDSDVETEVEITDDELEDLFSSLEDLEDLESLENIVDSDPEEFDTEE